MSHEARVVATMVELAESLVDDFDVVDLLTSLSDRCTEVLDVQAAGVMLASPEGHLRVLASSSSAMRDLELFEEQADEGPCRDCYVTGQPVVNTKLATVGGRWPRFAPLALAAGFQSAHAIPMRLKPMTIGALNLFRSDEGELRSDDLAIAQSLADMATIAVLLNREATAVGQLHERLSKVLHTRVAIEQAKGVVAQRTGLDMDQTFSLVRNYAARRHLRLGEVARDIVNRKLDPSALRPDVP